MSPFQYYIPGGDLQRDQLSLHQAGGAQFMEIVGRVITLGQVRTKSRPVMSLTLKEEGCS